MVVLPKDMVKTWYEGYYWSTKDKCLYSAKRGALRELSRARSTKHSSESGYQVSVDGVRRFMSEGTLRRLSRTYEIQRVAVQR